MTEKEKASIGKLYLSSDLELVQERENCKDLCFEYNNMLPSKKSEREDKIKELIGKIGDTFLIEQPFFCDYGYNIEIGENFYMNHNGIILDCAKVTFGDNVLIGPQCGFYAASHPIDIESRKEGLEEALPITIGNNVWIGGNVVVTGGVTIGDNSVIGAGSVVTKNIPPNVIAVGNPCKVLRNI